MLSCLLYELPFIWSESHIVPIIIGDINETKIVSDILLDKYNIYLTPIGPPTVPFGTSRLRINPTPAHTYKEIDYLVYSLNRIYNDLQLSRKIPESYVNYNRNIDYNNKISIYY